MVRDHSRPDGEIPDGEIPDGEMSRFLNMTYVYVIIDIIYVYDEYKSLLKEFRVLCLPVELELELELEALKPEPPSQADSEMLQCSSAFELANSRFSGY